MSSSLLLALLVLLLTGAGGLALLLLVDDEPRVALLLIPLEAGQVRSLEFVVRLHERRVVSVWFCTERQPFCDQEPSKQEKSLGVGGVTRTFFLNCL